MATVSHYQTAVCLWICVFRVPWEQVYRWDVAVVAFLKINLEKEKKRHLHIIWFRLQNESNSHEGLKDQVSLAESQ